MYSMLKKNNNYAYIDAQNVHLGIKSLGWEVEWSRFRVYLAEKYGVTKAYMFLGYLAENDSLYTSLREDGFVLQFKPVTRDGEGKPKGNVDADMVLRVLLDYAQYDAAVLITSDGDFYSLVRHLYEQDKLRAVLSPYVETCSRLLKREAKEKILYMDNLRKKIGKKKSTA